jgi:hypothetical protein
MSLQRRLDAFKPAFKSGGPPYNVFRERIETMLQATEDLRRSAIWRRRSTHQPGCRARAVRRLARHGPLVITFFRGLW